MSVKTIRDNEAEFYRAKAEALRKVARLFSVTAKTYSDKADEIKNESNTQKAE